MGYARRAIVLPSCPPSSSVLEKPKLLPPFRHGQSEFSLGHAPRPRTQGGTLAEAAAFLHAATQQARPATRTNEIRHDGQASVPPLLVPLAGLWSESLARELAWQRRGALDDARSVPRPRSRAGACLLRLFDHRGFLDGAVHVPRLARYLSALRRQHAEARSGRARALPRAGHQAPWADPDAFGHRVPAFSARQTGQLARPRDRGACRLELRHQQQ